MSVLAGNYLICLLDAPIIHRTQAFVPSRPAAQNEEIKKIFFEFSDSLVLRYVPSLRTVQVFTYTLRRERLGETLWCV